MRWLKTVGLVAAAAMCTLTVACGGEKVTEAAKDDVAPPPGLVEALKGHQTGDLIQTNNPGFQLQLSRFPWRYVVRMNAPREAVAPAVDAYFRGLGVQDMDALVLTYCESIKRDGEPIWSCSR
jgi:hypothetical protein